MPVPRNLFKHALAAGVPQIGLWSTLPDPYVSEIVSGAGFDWVLLDTEHTPTDVPHMLRQLQAVAAAVPAEARRRTSAVVRPDWNDPVLIKRHLDIGAQSLLLPFVQNADEAAAAVRATRYAPAGVRGMGGSVRASNFGRIPDYARRAADELCVLVQVETREAGHPEVRGAIDDAIRRIRARGKAPGILMLDETRARECLALGALFVAVAMDLQILARGAEAAARRFADDPARPAAGAVAY